MARYWERQSATSTGNVNPEIGKIRGNDTKRKIDVAGRLLARARA